VLLLSVLASLIYPVAAENTPAKPGLARKA